MMEKYPILFLWAKIFFAFTDLEISSVAFQCTLVQMHWIENVEDLYLLLLCQTWPLPATFAFALAKSLLSSSSVLHEECA